MCANLHAYELIVFEQTNVILKGTHFAELPRCNSSGVISAAG